MELWFSLILVTIPFTNSFYPKNILVFWLLSIKLYSFTIITNYK